MFLILRHQRKKLFFSDAFLDRLRYMSNMRLNNMGLALFQTSLPTENSMGKS